MKKVFGFILGMLLISSCSKEYNYYIDEPEPVPEGVTVTFDVEFESFKNVTVPSYEDFYNKFIVTKQLVPSNMKVNISGKTFDINKPFALNEGTYNIENSVIFTDWYNDNYKCDSIDYAILSKEININKYNKNITLSDVQICSNTILFNSAEVDSVVVTFYRRNETYTGKIEFNHIYETTVYKSYDKYIPVILNSYYSNIGCLFSQKYGKSNYVILTVTTKSGKQLKLDTLIPGPETGFYNKHIYIDNVNSFKSNDWINVLQNKEGKS